MSVPETSTECRGSVKLALNAKGEIQVEVKSYVGDSALALADARERAIFEMEQVLRHFSTKTPTTAGNTA